MECVLQIIFQKAFEIIYFKKSSTEEAKSVSTLRSVYIVIYYNMLYSIV